VSTPTDKRLIEDFLPIEAISAESSREKSVRKGHISTLHLWWARRPLVACRAAVYGALVPASQFVPNGATDTKKQSLGRANAAKFVERLCKYPGDPKVIADAQRHILDAHAERLTREKGKTVTREDIEEGRAPRPKVLDMFAGGGAIPLEVLRLGCEAYALDLNPVAHIIQRCTLVYPQKYGKPAPNIGGMTGPMNAQGETTWGGLAKEVRYYGERVLAAVKSEIGSLYLPITNPDTKANRNTSQSMFGEANELQPGDRLPVAYLWTRTVTCKNPSCSAAVPLYNSTWLSASKVPFLALEPIIDKVNKSITFALKQSNTKSEMGSEPDEGSYRGSTVCPFCGSAVPNTHVMDEGVNGRLGQLLMCVIVRSPGQKGRSFLPTHSLDKALLAEINAASNCVGLIPEETAKVLNVEIPFDKRESFWCRKYGLIRFGQLFTGRQQAFLGVCARSIRNLQEFGNPVPDDYLEALQATLTCWLDKLSEYNSSLCSWNTGALSVRTVFGRQALPMVWDFAEINPFSGVMCDAIGTLDAICSVIETIREAGNTATVLRTSATELPFEDQTIDCVVTDPPYYDNISYAKLSDFFYVWMRSVIGDRFAQHFASPSTPKKKEAIVDFARANGDRAEAARQYEELMHLAFVEAHRVLKPGGSLACVYAHKTTLGWASLVDSLRKAGFTLTEAWPLSTERKARIRAADNASLSSSIFLVGRKRDGNATGAFESEVQPELESIVRERVETLWDMGISGADLVIACVGAGLRAFTRFARVEYANGDEVPAERFLTEVETVVLDSILGRLSKEVGGKGTSLAGVDPTTRFYTLWRYTYRGADLDAGEAIIFANGTHVELDGPNGLSSGSRAIVEKKKGKYRIRDYTERGEDEHLGQPTNDGEAAPLVDVLHRVLWLMEHWPRELSTFLRETEPNREQLRLVAQALAGPALKGGEMADVSPSGEMAALAKLTSNWRSVIEDNATTSDERTDQKRGQKKLFE
jgi:putative DNA methylase